MRAIKTLCRIFIVTVVLSILIFASVPVMFHTLMTKSAEDIVKESFISKKKKSKIFRMYSLYFPELYNLAQDRMCSY